jgi:hypothetical protein
LAGTRESSLLEIRISQVRKIGAESDNNRCARITQMGLAECRKKKL